jgi:uncharacterized protein (TIGR03067 family)
MVQRVLFVLLLWVLASGRSWADDAVKKELARLDGTWALIKMEVGGKSLLEKDKPEPKLNIKEGKVTSDAKEAPQGGAELSKVLDPSRKPKQITVPNFKGGDPKKGVTLIGIYELNGDELRVCVQAVETANLKEREKERPTAFDSKQGVLLVFKGEKK